MNTPRSLTQLCAIANSCLVDDPPNKPEFDPARFEEMVGEEDLCRFSEHASKEPPGVQFYRGRFYLLTWKQIKHNGEDKLIIVMKDERGEVHTIMSDGEVIWSKDH